MPGAPFNPVTGQRAQMGLPATPGTILATFQVIGDDPTDEATQDTHANYVVCRGYEPDIDPFFRYLHDPKTKPDTKSIKVAKPYGVRGTRFYKRGQVIVAARIPTRLGTNQGKAATSVGHPVDLDEEVELLFDDDDVAIAWLDIGTQKIPIVQSFRAATATTDSSSPGANFAISSIDTLESNIGTHAGVELLTGERWKLESDSTIITDQAGGPSFDLSLWGLLNFGFEKDLAVQVMIGVQWRESADDVFATIADGLLRWHWNFSEANIGGGPEGGTPLTVTGGVTVPRSLTDDDTTGHQYRILCTTSWSGGTGPPTFAVQGRLAFREHY